MKLGEKLRTMRLQNRMTLAELSEKSGVSKSLLSVIERGHSTPTILSLKKIADAFSITISSLFTDIETEADSFNNRITSDSISGNKYHSFPSFMNKSEIDSKRVAIVRKGKRKKVIMPWGAFYEMLCPDLRHKIEFIYLTYPVGAKVGEFYSHEGEECGVVLEGKFRAIIGDEEIILEPGDSIYFDSSIPHRWETVGENEVKAIWAITPSSF